MVVTLTTHTLPLLMFMFDTNYSSQIVTKLAYVRTAFHYAINNKIFCLGDSILAEKCLISHPSFSVMVISIPKKLSIP